MSRPIRIEFKNALYHIVVRCIERSKLLALPKHKKLFLETLKSTKKSHNLIIHGYCIMDNHYHLQIETPMANIIKAMTRIQRDFSIKYNSENRRKGHVFEGRYKSYLVKKEKYLLGISRYIHLNPVKAGIVKQPERYKWSSYREYIGMDKYDLVDTDYVLSIYGRIKGESVRKYIEFVNEGIDIKIEPFKKAYGGYVLGDKDFVRKIKNMNRDKRINEEIRERKYLTPRISEEEIIRKVKGKIADEMYRKKVIIYLLRKYTETPIKKMAEDNNVHYTAISQLLRRNKEIIEKDIIVKSIEQEIEMSHVKT